jgi:hypothetical protein
MIIVKSREEIELMRESALIVSKTLGMIASEIKKESLPYTLINQPKHLFVIMAQCPVSWDYTAFQIALHESKLASGAWNS